MYILFIYMNLYEHIVYIGPFYEVLVMIIWHNMFSASHVRSSCTELCSWVHYNHGHLKAEI